MKLFFHAQARADLRGARKWYTDNGDAHIGDDFAAEVDRVVELILSRPKIGRVWPGEPGRHGVRRALLQRFPFAVAYVVGDAKVTIAAVVHFKRHPHFGLHRISRSI